jgi:hypothetical protein
MTLANMRANALIIGELHDLPPPGGAIGRMVGRGTGAVVRPAHGVHWLRDNRC